MKPSQGLDVCDHVQLAVDNQQQCIVDHEVTPAVTALEPLAPMAKRAKDTLATAQLEAVADMGSSHGEEVKQGLEEGRGPSIPQPTTSANSP
jgi:hypothetical protein